MFDHTDRHLADAYLHGVKDGIVLVNAALQDDKRPLYFCLPPKLALTEEQAADIVEREAKELNTPDPDGLPVVALLFAGLKNTFPCEGSNK